MRLPCGPQPPPGIIKLNRFVPGRVVLQPGEDRWNHTTLYAAQFSSASAGTASAGEWVLSPSINLRSASARLAAS